MHAGRVNVFDGDELFLTGTKQANGMYKLGLTDLPIARCNLITKSMGDALIWHNRLMHVNFADLHRLRDRLGLTEPNIQKMRCETCLLAKAKELPHPGSWINSCILI